MTICVLSGGVGAAKMIQALTLVHDPSAITAVVNTGDDLVLHGLRICPDLDTILYTLAGLNNEETGWGLAGESWRVRDELALLGGEAWFSLGDRDLATHLYRTERLRQGADLTSITAELANKFGVPVTLLPATHELNPTRFVSTTGDLLSFQEYFVKHRHNLSIASIDLSAAQASTVTDQALAALSNATRIVIAPSNPLISIGPLLALHPVMETLRRRREDVVAVSPLVHGSALKGPAQRLMNEMGLEATALGVASLYRDIVGTMVIDVADSALESAIQDLGMGCVVTNTIMDGAAYSDELANKVLYE